MLKYKFYSKLSLNFVLIMFLLIINFKFNSTENNSSEMSSKTISTANNYFAFNLLKKLSDKNQNVLISPFSITTVFNMLYFGAKERTAEEIEDVFGLRLLNQTKEQIGVQYKQLFNHLMANNWSDSVLVANHLVVQKRNPILEGYEKELRDYFNTSIQTVDFLFKSDEAVQQINQWISKSTRGKIVKLLDEPLSPLSVLVLLNAVYFKGRWRQQFLKWATKEEDFHSLNKVIKVSQMKLSNAFNYTTVPQLNDSQLIELPYSNDSNISMYVLLPVKSSDIQSICHKLNVNLFDEAITNLSVTNVRLILPRFNITANYELKNTLQKLGIRQTFTYKSDLSGIDGTNYLHVSEVYHKTIIEVNEEGSEAVASTGLVVQSRGLFGRYRNVPTFRADHPFIFIIRHKNSGLILFIGILNSP